MKKSIAECTTCSYLCWIFRCIILAQFGLKFGFPCFVSISIFLNIQYHINEDGICDLMSNQIGLTHLLCGTDDNTLSNPIKYIGKPNSIAFSECFEEDLYCSPIFWA